MLTDTLLQIMMAWVGVELLYFLLRFFRVLPLLDVKATLGSKGKTNANNNGFRILMKKSVVMSNPNAEGIFAQEYREFFSRPYLTIRLLEVFSKKLQRRTEYKGHALEIAWRYKFIGSEGTHEYRISEAKALIKYKQFKDIPLLDIINKLEYYHNDAMNYLNKHEYSVKRMYGKIEEKL